MEKHRSYKVPSDHMISHRWGFRPSDDLSSYAKSCHVQHVYIHNSFNHSLPFTVCKALTFFLCRKSAPKVSHSSCTRSSWPQRAATRTAVQPSWGKGATVDCDTTNRRGVSGVWHKVFRKSWSVAKLQHLTLLTIKCICVGVSFDVEMLIQNCFYYFYYTRLIISIPKSIAYMEQTHKHTTCYFLNTPTTYYLEMIMNNAQFHYKGICRVRWIMFTSLISHTRTK